MHVWIHICYNPLIRCLTMAEKYDLEYNRTFPRQKEGPEYTPYVNKRGKRKKITAHVPAVASAIVTAVVLFGIFSSSLSLVSVGTDAAQISCDITKETETDIVEYVLYTDGEAVFSGELEEGHTEIALENLSPDTPYTFIVLKNGSTADSMNFRTLPAGGSSEPKPGPEPDPVPDPVPEPEPEPESDPEPENDPEPEYRPSSEPKPDPETESEPGPETEPGPALTDMTFDSLDGGVGSAADGEVSLLPHFTMNDSVMDHIVILMDGYDVPFTEADGVYYPSLHLISGDERDFTMVVYFTTGESEIKSAAVSVTVTVPYPGGYLTPTIEETAYAVSDFVFYPEILLSMNSFEFIDAQLSSADGTHTFGLTEQIPGDYGITLVNKEGIDMLYDEPEDIFDTLDWNSVWTKQMILHVRCTDPMGNEQTEDFNITVQLLPAYAGYAQYDPSLDYGLTIRMNGISSGASVDRVEMYGSDDPLVRGDCLYAYADREFVHDPDDGSYLASYTAAETGLDRYTYVTPVVFIYENGEMYRIVLNTITK